MSDRRSGVWGRLAGEASRREAAGLRRRVRPRTPDHDGLLDLASNDYLGLSQDARLVEAATRSTRRWGTGSTGSRLVTGSTALHVELEQRLAGFAGSGAALVFSSGYLANLAAVTTLSGPGTLVISDAANHASIVDACRLSRARVAVTGHNDVAAVEQELAERREESAIMVTDAVFSVDGDRAPLTALYDTCHRHGAILLVDEAHALGVLGDLGRGAVADAGLANMPDVVRTLTLSKSLGSQGGAVLAESEVIEALVNTGRPFIFDTALAPGCVGAALAALDVLDTEPDRPGLVRARARDLATIASGHGWSTIMPDAAVVPVILGTPTAAVEAASICVDHGVRAGCFRPPAVPDGRSCLRFTARAPLTDGDLDLADKALAAVASAVAT